MIETGEVRKLFTGPPEVVATLVHQARVLLGGLKNDMRFNSLLQGERRVRVPVNQRLLSYSDSPERTIEVRAEGIALVSAGSRFGQDWIGIDATAVTIITKPQTEGSVPAYFRVLVERPTAEEEASFLGVATWCWEPYRADLDTEALAAAPGDSWLKQGLSVAQAGSHDGGGDLQNTEHYLRIWEEAGFAEIGEWNPRTTHGLYGTYYSAFRDHFQEEYDEGYQSYIVLDPDDPERISTPNTFFSDAFGGFTHQVAGEAQPGWYVCKMGSLIHYRPLKFRVELGKPVEKFDFEIQVALADPFDPVTVPDGQNHGTHKSHYWWQGALLINPIEGAIAFVEDGPFLPHWGFTDSVLAAPDLSQAVLHYHSMSQQK